MKKILSKITRKMLLIIYFALLMLVLTFIGIMGRLGYKVINPGLEYTLFAMLACSALILGTWAIVRRMNTRVLKWVFGILGSVLTGGAALVMISFFMFMQIYSVPEPFTYLTSPSGKTAVILRGYIMDDDKVSARAEARRAADPESSEEIEFEDFAYYYKAYPRFMRFFYNTNADASGDIEIGCGSKAILMNEWLDDDTLHLFIQDAETFDHGEWTLNI